MEIEAVPSLLNSFTMARPGPSYVHASSAAGVTTGIVANLSWTKLWRKSHIESTTETETACIV